MAERRIAQGPTGEPEHRLRWDDLDVLYFLGYALWNYAVTPYLFLWQGFETREGGVWQEPDGARWRRLHVTYPTSVPTHSREQTLYFDERGWLQRLDYTAEIFGQLARAAHYCSSHQVFDGLVFPTHRVVWWRRPSGRPLRLMTVMEGWVDDVATDYDADTVGELKTIAAAAGGVPVTVFAEPERLRHRERPRMDDF